MSPVDSVAFRAEWVKSPTMLTLRTETGVEFNVGSQVFDVPEAVYFGSQNNLIDGIIESLSSCNSVLSELHLVGKGSLFPGLAERLHMELSARAVNVEVVARPDRAQQAYSNTAMRFAKQNGDAFIVKDAYDQIGPDAARDLIDASPVWQRGFV